MPDYTTKLNLAKPNATTEPNNTFNLDTYLNNNWDKIDAFAGNTITTDKLINNLASTEPGFGLDSRQGTAIGNRLTIAEGTISSHTSQLLDAAHKDGTIQTNLNADMLDGIQGTQIPLKTLADTTYYVDTTNGNDTNNGLTSGMAFRTIAKAISSIPQIVNHIITINVASGIYSEIPTFNGKYGSGTIILNGDTAVSSTRVTTAIKCIQCGCKIVVNGFKLSNANDICFYVISCDRVEGNYLNIIDTSTSYGAGFEFSKGYLNNSVISNKAIGIVSNASIICSNNNSGSGNTIALQAIYGGTIGKYGTQPNGTTSETTIGGGAIR